MAAKKETKSKAKTKQKKPVAGVQEPAASPTSSASSAAIVEEGGKGKKKESPAKDAKAVEPSPTSGEPPTIAPPVKEADTPLASEPQEPVKVKGRPAKQWSAATKIADRLSDFFKFGGKLSEHDFDNELREMCAEWEKEI